MTLAFQCGTGTLLPANGQRSMGLYGSIAAIDCPVFYL
jgi:hypothetical protein